MLGGAALTDTAGCWGIRATCRWSPPGNRCMWRQLLAEQIPAVELLARDKAALVCAACSA